MLARLAALLIVLPCWVLAATATAAPAAGVELGTAPRAQPIIGGQPTEPGEFAGVVAIEVGPFLCTGTVVAPKLILTAAHCLDDVEQYDRVVVHYGDDIGGGAVDADGWGVHPQYCAPPECKLDIFDYAYVTIPVEFIVPGGFTLPIVDQDEWDEAMSKGEQVTLVGFGGDAFKNGKITGAGVKREVDTTIGKFSPKGLEFFAGGGQRDTCEGDSGGPAFVRLASGALRLAGITSRGTNPCGNGGYYGAPYPALCWVRDETGVDLVGAECSACDCLDTSPPKDDGRCSFDERESGSDGVLGLTIAIIAVGRARRRRRSA